MYMTVTAQSAAQGPEQATYGFQKGQGYLHWGWNRAVYSKSDIHFQGPDYNFTLYKVVAHDRPTLPITPKRYLLHLFTPQTNYKAGYFIADNLAVSFGVDHMKYVMDRDQTVDMKGVITRNDQYMGNHNGPQKLTPDFLTFEHTNGLNYINLELEQYFSLYHARSGKLDLRSMLGGGGGILFPKTDVKLLDYKEDDRFHVSGFGFSAKAGIAAVIFHHLFWKLEGKGGYIDMPSIVLNEKGIPAHARQHFFFGEADTNLGFIVNIKNTKKARLHREARTKA